VKEEFLDYIKDIVEAMDNAQSFVKDMDFDAFVHYRRIIIELLLILRENPVPAEYHDIRSLGCTDTYRARIGDIRVIYEIIWNRRIVNVLLIEPRETAYS
jgi:mRNA-degrading endonuclease RelE of RelBE toxin-antitoxin system